MAYTENYRSEPRTAILGVIGDNSMTRVITRSVATSAGLAFGVPAAQGAADNECVLPTTSATNIVGFTVRSHAVPAETPNLYPENYGASLLAEGSIWATVTDAGGVSAGDDVWLDLSDNTLSNADVGSGNGLKLAGCRWVTSAANGALALVRVNFDVPAVAGAA